MEQDSFTWYSASLLFKSNINDKQGESGHWEESIVLIKALNDSDAEKKAVVIGKKSEIVYENNLGGVCHWVFMGLGGIYQVIDEKIDDGCEVFSRFLSPEEAVMLLSPLSANS